MKNMNMNLYLVRHGDALAAPTDTQRPLSPTGTLQIQQVAAYLHDQNTQISHIYHSGLLRAQQSAAILAERLGVSDVACITGLKPDDAIDQLIHTLPDWHENTLLVSHLPYLADLLYALIGPTHLEFYTATVIALTRQQANWQLLFCEHTLNV